MGHHGKPVAFYSDKHSIFRVNQEGTSGRSCGITQFGRALGSRLAAALAPILDDLGRLGEDMDSIGEGLREADEPGR